MEQSQNNKVNKEWKQPCLKTISSQELMKTIKIYACSIGYDVCSSKYAR